MAPRNPKINRNRKDPDLKEVLTLIDQSSDSLSQISVNSGVSVSTLRNWDQGVTMRPQNTSINMVLRALGYSRKIIKD